MLETILYTTESSTTSLSMETILACSAVSILLGLVIAVAYRKSSRTFSRNYLCTLVILPILVQVVITMVNGNLGTGIAILGAFSLVRFRSIPGSSREISGVFFAMAVGLATGMGYLGFAVIITLIVCVLMILLDVFHFGEKKTEGKALKITIPENLNYEGLFDDIFDRFTRKAVLDKVKTTNMGSMFELSYQIEVKEGVHEKELIDEIRCRNGNLTVICARSEGILEEL